MNNTKSVTIALLCVSASILVTALVLMHVSARPALGDTPTQGGDYIMLTGAFTKSTDLVFVTDIAQQKINVYYFDYHNNTLRLIDQMNLKRDLADR